LASLGSMPIPGFVTLSGVGDGRLEFPQAGTDRRCADDAPAQ
jgi:hypothetical protein